MKRGFSATISAAADRPLPGHPAPHRGASNHTEAGADENTAPNQQPKSLAYASTLVNNKPVHGASAAPTAAFEKESIARNTRAAVRRHALGDVSNVALLNQV
jgi:hypothetical protein